MKTMLKPVARALYFALVMLVGMVFYGSVMMTPVYAFVALIGS